MFYAAVKHPGIGRALHKWATYHQNGRCCILEGKYTSVWLCPMTVSNRAVPLPHGLTVVRVRNAIDLVEQKAEELIDLYFRQASFFSGVVACWAFAPWTH